MERRSVLERGYTTLRAHPFAADALLAALLVVVLALPTWSVYGDQSLLISLGLVVPLAWRRTATVPAVAVIAAAAFFQVWATPQLYATDVAVPLAFYALAAYAPAWAGRLGLALGALGSVLAADGLSQDDEFTLAAGSVLSGAVILSAWALGRLRRLARRDALRLAERARLLEVERDQEMRLAATAERARIARELHDVVAHSLAVTIAQADGGRYAAAADPAAATAALETISATGRQALADMRALLGVLRDGAGPEHVPQPDIDAIPGLVENLAAGGLEVTLEQAGAPRPLPAGPGLAAYRIVQESLTNVLKHAGPGSRARVRLGWAPAALEILVLDDGRGAAARAAAPPGSGQGLLGMRERAALHGGTVEAGPRPGGGFGVRALLPYGRVP